MKRADAVLFATPEYNRSGPGITQERHRRGLAALRRQRLGRKTCAVISASPGALGAFGANHHLRQALVFLNMPVMQQPEAYIGGVDKLFDAAGEFVNPSTREFFTKFLQAFDSWIRRQLRPAEA